MARFVGTALFVQLAMFAIAFYLTEGMNPLLNPASMVTVTLGAGYMAAVGPIIGKKPGRIGKVAPLTVLIPFALVLVGIPIAVVIQETDFTSMTRSLLFAPWWLAFIGMFLVFIYIAYMENLERSIPHPLWLKLLAILGIIWGVSLYLFLMVIMAGTYL